MAYNRNQGIIMSGGTLTATNVATGPGAQINQTLPGGPGAADEVHKQLALFLKALEQHGNLIQNPDEVNEATESLKEEITREKPNRVTLKSLMAFVTDSVKSASGLALAFEGLKTAVTLLMG